MRRRICYGNFDFILQEIKELSRNFLKCVIWTDPTEVKQATELLSRWTEVDVDDALELLGPTFRNKAVRAYAVERLRKADDDVPLSLYSGNNIGIIALFTATRPSFEIRKHNKFEIYRSNTRFLTSSFPHFSIHTKSSIRE